MESLIRALEGEHAAAELVNVLSLAAGAVDSSV
jgi:hypothetical protein